ncbi:MAG: hypothetical protein ABSE44_15445 [Candidatus Sulfotelmatobacter sp.]
MFSTSNQQFTSGTWGSSGCCGLRPRRRASTITGDQLGKLLIAVKEVLKEAIALGGSSISDYVNSDGEEGSQAAAATTAPSARGELLIAG